MIDLSISMTAYRNYVVKRLHRMFPLTYAIELLVSAIPEHHSQGVQSDIAIHLDGTVPPESASLTTDQGGIDVSVGLHSELIEHEFTEVQFTRSLRRLIEVALIRMPIPQGVRLAIRDAVDRWYAEGALPAPLLLSHQWVKGPDTPNELIAKVHRALRLMKDLERFAFARFRSLKVRAQPLAITFVPPEETGGHAVHLRKQRGTWWIDAGLSLAGSFDEGDFAAKVKLLVGGAVVQSPWPEDHRSIMSAVLRDWPANGS
jgi:hypothetical protein